MSRSFRQSARGEKFGVKDKVVQKMTKDGLVERNVSEGEEKRISMRNVDFLLRDKADHEPGYSGVPNTPDFSRRKKRLTQRFQESQKRTDETAHNPSQPAEQFIPPPVLAREDNITVDDPDDSPSQSHSLPIIPPIHAVLTHESGTRLNIQDKTAFHQDEQSAMRHDPPTEALPGKKSSHTRINHAQESSLTHDNPTLKREESPQSGEQLAHDSAGRLQFTREDAAPPIPQNHKQRKTEHQVIQDLQAQNGDTAAHVAALAPLPSSRKNPIKPQKSDKLQFSREETPSPENRKLAKAERQVQHTGNKLEKAREHLPAKRHIRTERTFDEATGTAKRRLSFEKEVKSQAQHIKGPLLLRPVKAGANAAIVYSHRKLYQVEHENVGTEAAHKVEMLAEGGIRSALRFHKTAPYSKVARLERTMTKKSMKLSYQKALADNPSLRSNAASRFMQKRKIRRQYAKASRDVKKAAKTVKQAGSIASRAAKAVAGMVYRHPAVAGGIVIGVLLLFAMMSLVSMFSSIGSSGLRGIITASYLAEDADIDNVEVAYTEWETDLRLQIENAESDYPDFDEYVYELDTIGHSPFELLAYLTVAYQNFPYSDIAEDLRELFDEQYSLTFTESTETRYDGDGDPYEWHILTVKLEVTPLSEIIAERLNEDQQEHYTALMETKGGRQYAGSPFAFDWTPYISSPFGWRADPFTGEKSYHTGIDIAVPVGTPIIAAHDGVVTQVVWGTTGYGRYITVEGKNGLSTRYAHCDTLLASVGQKVEAGELIATSGNTGNSTGPHLHYEVILNGAYTNPIFFANTSVEE